MDSIKLVVWDLDETFWQGTLSEEGITLNEQHITIVKELTNRGIINSIVSKNDFEEAKDALQRAGIWDSFIFPQIEWSPKGPLIKNLIEKCRLRDVNVLFLDDNHLNLEEARFYNPGLHVKPPEFIPDLLAHPALKGKDDSSHSRLKQYKILEKKDAERPTFNSNEEFLRASDIRVEIITGVEQHKARLTELLNRTNQLNFTKKRVTEQETDQLIARNDLEMALIRVSDRYGDYGITGFYALHKTENQLTHFTFSCRILNLGVVQYIYHKLDRPAIDIVPDVAEEPGSMTVDWITEKESIQKLVPKKSASDGKSDLTIMFKGSCDLNTIFWHLEKELPVDVIKEVHFFNENNFPIHTAHTQSIVDSINLSEINKSFIVKNIPFYHDRVYSNDVFKRKYDLLILSVLNDYSQNIYRHKLKDIYISHGSYIPSLTDEKEHDYLIDFYSKKKWGGITKEKLTWISQNFEFVGRISTKAFTENLRFIRKNISSNIPIIFFNGAEIDSPAPNEHEAKDRHIVMNAALENFIATSNNCYLLDIRKIVFNNEHITDLNRHYTRERYKIIEEELSKMVNSLINVRITEPYSISKFVFEIKKQLLQKNLVPAPVLKAWRNLKSKEDL